MFCFGFNTVFDGYLEAGWQLLENERPGGFKAVVVSNKNRVGELAFVC